MIDSVGWVRKTMLSDHKIWVTNHTNSQDRWKLSPELLTTNESAKYEENGRLHDPLKSLYFLLTLKICVNSSRRNCNFSLLQLIPFSLVFKVFWSLSSAFRCGPLRSQIKESDRYQNDSPYSTSETFNQVQHSVSPVSISTTSLKVYFETSFKLSVGFIVFQPQ